MNSRLIVVAAAIAVTSACGPGGGQPQAPAPISGASATSREPAPANSSRAGAPAAQRPSTGAAWGLRIDAPRAWAVRHDFAHGYLANDSWKSYAGPDSHGTAIVSFTLPGSNEITSAEIRIGASRDAREIAQCTVPPDAVRSGSVHRDRIGDQEFTAFAASDAAMSHWLDVRGYRAVHGGACYAVDLLVYGTNPAVYDPPATPPFSREQAFARMTAVLRTFRFTR